MLYDRIRSLFLHPKHRYVVIFLMGVYDCISVLCSYFLALWGRYDFIFSNIPLSQLQQYWNTIFLYFLFCLIIFAFARMYTSMWRYAGVTEVLLLVSANYVTVAFYFLVMKLLDGDLRFSYFFMGGILQLLLISGGRFSYRVILKLRELSNRQKAKDQVQNRVMMIGAGAAGQMILREVSIASNPAEVICCVIDDNEDKWGRYLNSVPIVGGRETILENVEKYRINTIYLAIPSASAEEKRDILTICNESGCKIRVLPGIQELIHDSVSVSQLRDVAVEDLLGREPIENNMEEVFQFIAGKVILVTGGGGSIGSELCRQIAAHHPRQLIIFDVYENNAYDIQLELKERYPKLDLVTLIGSVRDSRRLQMLFDTYHPEIVYHAAAHKHVPLMEDSPCEAIKNNALGTYKTAYAAASHNCARFVLISTDKAVNPTNVMGASKRLCEMIIQSFDAKIKAGKGGEISMLFTHGDTEVSSDLHDGKEECIQSIPADCRTEFVAVRFGNVLGSNGSVIPLFKRQIAKGGPVTVTHPDIIRYFMTIPEAAGLVLLASTYAQGGEIFVLDMGSPMKIDDLARNLIRLSGHRPDVDIPIVYSGLRPGEKLFEEKLMAEEGLKMSPNQKIFIGQPIVFDVDSFLLDLRRLMGLAYQNQEEKVVSEVKRMVPTFHPLEKKE